MSETLKTKIEITVDAGAAISAIKNTTQAINSADQSVQGVSTSLTRLTAIAGSAVGFGAIAAELKDFKQAAAVFDKAIVEIGTLSADAKAHLGEYRQEIVALSLQTGQPLERLTKGLYDSISAGVGAGDAMKFMAAASQLATAGVSNTAATVDLLTSVLNAYGLPATEADHISDQLFATVQQGKTKIDDLAHALGRVAPIMKAAGATTAEMMAATADLTNKLPSTAEAVTGLTALTAGLARGNKELTVAFKEHGYESALAAIKAKGFGEALKILNEESGGTLDGMIKLIPEITGANAAVALGINNAQAFSEKLQRVTYSSGLTSKAVKEISETADMMSQKLDAAGIAVKKAFGDDLIETFGKSNGALREFLNTLATDKETRQLAETMALVSVGALASAAALQKIIYPLEAYIVKQRAATAATAATTAATAVAEAANLAAARSMGAYGAATAEATAAVGLSTAAILGSITVIAGSAVSVGYAISAWRDWKNAEKDVAISLRQGADLLSENSKKIHDYALAHADTAIGVGRLTSLVKMGIVTQDEATAATARYAKEHAVSTEQQVAKAKRLTAEEQKELDRRLNDLEQFNDRWLKATLEKSAYELQAAQKQYDEDFKLAGKNSALQIKALETYVAAAKKIQDDVADKLDKTRDAEGKKEADALRKTLDMREGYAVDTAKILSKQDEAEVKALEEKIKKTARTNTVSIGQFTEYQNALKALTAKRFVAEEASQEKHLIKMLEAEGLTDAEREDIIAQHVARVAAIRGEEAAKEIVAMDGVTAAVEEHARKQDEFWNTFKFNSDTMAELSKTTWTGIRDQIKTSIKTMKFDIAGLGDFFKNTLIEMVATAAANQLVLSIAGGGSLLVSSIGSAASGAVGQGAGGAVGAFSSGAGTFGMGAAGAGASGMYASQLPLVGNAPAIGIGPTQPGILYTQNVGYSYAGVGLGATAGALGGRYVGQQVGGNRETTNAAGVAGGAAAGAYMAYGGSVGGPWGAVIGAIIGLLMANYGPGDGGPQGYDKSTFGGIGHIRNHPHDALAADTRLLGSHMQSGDGQGASLVLKQINELNTATSLLDQNYFKDTASGQAMAANWEALTTQGAALAATIDKTGLSSSETAVGMTAMGTSAEHFAMNAILGGQAGSELTASAVGIVGAMNQAATATDKTLQAMSNLADALYKAGENTWALSRASGAAQVAQQMLNLSADLTYEQYQKLGQASTELTKIEQRRAELMKELAAGVDPARFAEIQAELIGLNSTSKDYISSVTNIGTATEAATGSTDALATNMGKCGTAATEGKKPTDELGKSYGDAGINADYAAGRVYALRDAISSISRSGGVTIDVKSNGSASAGKRADVGEWFVPANDVPYSLHYGETVLPPAAADTYRSLVTEGLWNPLSRGMAPSSPLGGQQTANLDNRVSIVINAAPGMDVQALSAELERRLRQVILEQSERGIPWMHPRGLFGAA